MNTNKCKKKILCIICLTFCVMIIVLFYFGKEKKEGLTDEIAASILAKTWEQLSSSEKSEITNGVSDGSVSECIIAYDKNATVQLFYLPEEYYGQEVYVVTFISSKRDFLGDIVKIVDKKSGLIVGYNFRL